MFKKEFWIIFGFVAFVALVAWQCGEVKVPIR